MQKLDYLFFGAHPDDVELSASGTILEAVSRKKNIGIIDLTLGELGSRGNIKTRLKEANEAKKLLGIIVRENLKLKDGFFENNKISLLKVITTIRKYKPEVVFANSLDDRHPDHSRAAKLVADACFYSGLIKIKTGNLDLWKPKKIFYYIQDKQLEPTFVINISNYFEQKKKIVSAYSSQFYNLNFKEKQPQTYISTPLFWKNLETKARNMGQKIGVEFGEGFICKQTLGLNNIDDFLDNFF